MLERYNDNYNLEINFLLKLTESIKKLEFNFFL